MIFDRFLNTELPVFFTNLATVLALFITKRSFMRRMAHTAAFFTPVLCSLLLSVLCPIKVVSSQTTLQLLPYHHVRQRHLQENGQLPNDLMMGSLPDHEPYSRHDVKSKLHTRRDLRTSQIASLYQGYGTHFVDLWVGTPSYRQTVIVDTGSGVTAFPCAGCTMCGKAFHTDGYFDPSKSSTFHFLTCNECRRGICRNGSCHIGMSYAEGSSWNANEVSDVVYAGGLHDVPVHSNGDHGSTDIDGTNPYSAREYSFNLRFGCMTDSSGLFRTQLADGIMGMSAATQEVFWRQMYNSKQIERANFSLCFSRALQLHEFGNEAGVMTLGGVDSRLHQVPMGFMKYVDSLGFFGVNVEKIYVHTDGGDRFGSDIDLHQGETIPVGVSSNVINEHSVILDSGTTDTYMTSKISAAFNQAWSKATGSNFPTSGVSISGKDLQNWPTIIFQFSVASNRGNDGPLVNHAEPLDPLHPADILVAFPPSHYMEYDESKKMFFPRFFMSESVGSVLGANFLRGHDVFFDPDHGQIGIAESHCSYSNLVHGAPITEHDPYSVDEGWMSGMCLTSSCGTEITIAVVSLCAIIGVLFWKDSKKSVSYESTNASENEAAPSNLPSLT